MQINADTKTVITETRFDDPRDINVGIAIETNWIDRRGNVLMQNRFLPPGETTFYFTEQTHWCLKVVNRSRLHTFEQWNDWLTTLSTKWKFVGDR